MARYQFVPNGLVRFIVYYVIIEKFKGAKERHLRGKSEKTHPRDNTTSMKTMQHHAPPPSWVVFLDRGMADLVNVRRVSAAR
jgi:hypothetical protein